MSEEVLNTPLGGDEIIEAILYRVREQLTRDCFLSPNSAYEKFSGKIHIEVLVVDGDRSLGVTRDMTVTLGEPIDVNDEPILGVSTEIIEEEPPNVVRRESEQAIPVLTDDGTGKKEMRKVKYKRRG